MLTTDRPTRPAPVEPAAMPRRTWGRAARGAAGRAAWLTGGVGLTSLAIVGVARGTAPWWVLALFAVLPDLSLLAAAGEGDDVGRQLPRRAVPIYNSVHSLLAPAAVLIGTAAGVLPAAGTVAGLAWAAHVAFDRAAGYGLRDREGRQRG